MTTGQRYLRLLVVVLITAGQCWRLPAQEYAQHYEVRSAVYNVLLGGLSAGVVAIINNNNKKNKPVRAFRKGFLTGCAGGALMFGGKQLNYLIAKHQQPGYAWLSRAVFSAGNSIVENAACGITWWERWHFDVGFVRLEYEVAEKRLTPRVMVSSLGGFVFTAVNGRLDLATSFRSGTITFKSRQINYAPYLVGSTTGNYFILSDTLGNGILFHEIYAHEMVHTFQFQETSAMNYSFNGARANMQERSLGFARVSRWVYGDLNYELMLANYFLVQGGVRRSLYCKNFLENEAEVLSTGRVSCPPTP